MVSSVRSPPSSKRWENGAKHLFLTELLRGELNSPKHAGV